MTLASLKSVTGLPSTLLGLAWVLPQAMNTRFGFSSDIGAMQSFTEVVAARSSAGPDPRSRSRWPPSRTCLVVVDDVLGVVECQIHRTLVALIYLDGELVRRHRLGLPRFAVGGRLRRGRQRPAGEHSRCADERRTARAICDHFRLRMRVAGSQHAPPADFGKLRIRAAVRRPWPSAPP